MKLSTEVSVPEAPRPITYGSKILCLGSCFAEHISDKLDYFKFQVTSNPFGILFTPPALLNIIEKTVKKEEFTTNDIFQTDEKWQSFYAHSRLGDRSAAKALAALNSAESSLFEAIQTSTHIIITLGSAYVYKHLDSGLMVANCHKQPQALFTKQLLAVYQLHDMLKELIGYCRRLNNDLKFTFTVSPVRHSKDGMVENQRSKAHLLAAVHQTLDEDPQTQYFPSYEIMMDELRDYRFYKRDLIHPNDLAIDLIWKKFKSSIIDKSINQDMDRVEKLQTSLAHRSSISSGKAYEKLKTFQDTLTKEITSKYPFMNF